MVKRVLVSCKMDWGWLLNRLGVVVKRNIKVYLTQPLIEVCKIKNHHFEQGKDVNNAFCDKHRVAVGITHASSA